MRTRGPLMSLTARTLRCGDSVGIATTSGLNSLTDASERRLTIDERAYDVAASHGIRAGRRRWDVGRGRLAHDRTLGRFPVSGLIRSWHTSSGPRPSGAAA